MLRALQGAAAQGVNVQSSERILPAKHGILRQIDPAKMAISYP